MNTGRGKVILKRQYRPLRRLGESGIPGLWLWVMLLVATGWINHCRAATFIVGTQNVDYYPHYDFASARPTYARAVFDAFAAVSGHEFKFVALPIKRLHRRFFEKHQVDLLYPDNRNWTPALKQGQSLAYSQPLVKSISGTLVRREKSGQVANDIGRLATVRGFTPTKWRTRQAAGQVIVVETSTVPAALQLTLLGRVQGCDIDYSVANYHLVNINRGGSLVLNHNLPYSLVGFHLSSIRHPKLIDEFNTFLAGHQPLLRRLQVQFGIQEQIPPPHIPPKSD